MNKKNNRKGFTILELVIVIAVIAILATVLIPTFGSIIEKANNSKLLQELKNEYTEYAVTVAPESIQDDIVIKIGEKYYQINDGAPEASDGVVTALQNVPESGVVFCSGCNKVLTYESGSWTGCTCNQSK